jgi:uncharacterized protein YdbL (DUF1318 family)
MKTFMCVLAVLVMSIGCARVQVQAPKEPIKVDISMRLDVYQHVEKDIDAIENLVTGAPEKPQSKATQNMFGFFITDAYAQEGLSPEIEAAAIRRRNRRSELVSWEQQGVVGENKSGLVEMRMPEKANASVNTLIQSENNDRMIIYQGVAAQNGTSVAEVQALYAKRLQGDAPGGTPIQVEDGTWQTK